MNGYNKISLAILCGLFLSLIIAYFFDTSGASLLKRGDFPGFYVLAIIKKLGLTSRIFDPELQRQIENQFWPSFKGGFYMSVYPLYTSTLLYPLSFFPPQAAQLIFILFMLACFTACLNILKNINLTIKNQNLPVLAANLTFAPLFIALFGAQNTALSMLLYAGILYLFKENNNKAFFYAGLLGGLWLYKPQFGIFIFPVFVAARLWPAVLGFISVAFIYQLIAWYDSGFFWFVDWIKTLQVFSVQNFVSNAAQSVSLSGTLKAALGNSPEFSLIISGLLVLIFTYYLIFTWKLKRKDLYKSIMLFGPLLLLVSPQSLFYDLGIAFTSYFTILNFEDKKTYTNLIFLNSVSWILVLGRELVPVPVFFLIAIYFFIKIIYSINEPKAATH